MKSISRSDDKTNKLKVLPLAEKNTLRLTPITLKEANAFVAEHHRHHKPVPGAKFCVAASEGNVVRGVAIVGRPVSRMLDNGFTLEVNRVCTDGARNACSMLYGAAWRAAKSLGFMRLITYTLPEEGGASLRAAGFVCVGERGGGSWSRPNAGRPRVDVAPMQSKLLWDAPNQKPLVGDSSAMETSDMSQSKF